MIHLIWSILIGFVIGLIATAIVPQFGHFGFIYTTLIGIGGSFLGGFITSLIWRPAQGAYFHPAGFVVSILGAILLLFILSQF